MKKKEVFFIIIATFMLALAWIIFSIVHASISSTISTELSTKITPITPSFDLKTIDKLKERKDVDPILKVVITPATNEVSTSSSSRPTPTPTLPPSITFPLGTISGQTTIIP